MTVRWNAQPTLRRPALVAAFSGWNDAADAASDGVRWLARSVGRACVRDARQRGVPRLPGRPSDGRAGRRCDPRDPVARARVLGRIDTRRRPRSRAAAGRGAEPALADVLRRRDLRRARDRMRDRRDARRPARRRSPHPSHPVHRLRHRRGARGEARHATFAVPGPDRHRRCAARRGRAASGSRRRRSGRRCRITSRPRPTRRRPTRCSTRLGTLLDVGFELTDLEIAASAWERSVDEVVAGDADASSYVERLEQRYDEANGLDVAATTAPTRSKTTRTGSTRTTCRRGSHSRRTSSATSASSPTNSRDGPSMRLRPSALQRGATGFDGPGLRICA